MAQTRVTYDVSSGGKVKADATTAMIRHWARDTDAQNGIERSHSNEAIDTSRSINNMSYFPTDGPRDEWITPGSTEEIQQRLQDRLATVTGRKRKDAVVMRGIVLGLSPEWVEEHTPNWKTDPQDREAFMDALQPVVDIVIEKAGGPKNIVLVTGHFDEEAPQIQMGMTPVTEDGRLRQNDFELFKSPKNLGGLHKKIRKELKESGLDVILESSERSREHLSNLEYARKADQERAKEIEEFAEQRKEIAKERKEIAAERERLDEDKAKLPEMKRYAAQQGREEGRKQGYVEGREEAGTILANARDKANDIVAQAHAQVQRLRDESDELDEKRKQKTTLLNEETALLQETSDAVTAKYDELQQVREEVEAVKSSRDAMSQLDSDFLDEMLKYPKVKQRHDDFKQGRVRGLKAVVDGTKDYYERTVGENRQRRQQRITRENQQQQTRKYPTQKGYTPYF